MANVEVEECRRLQGSMRHLYAALELQRGQGVARMDFIGRILAAVAGFLAESLSYLATKIVTLMYPTASYNEILTHSNSASDTAAGVLAAIIIAWALWAAWQIAAFVVGMTIGLLWSEMKSR